MITSIGQWRKKRGIFYYNAVQKTASSPTDSVYLSLFLLPVPDATSLFMYLF